MHGAARGILLASMVLFVPRLVFACSCITPGVREEKKRAALVFVAKVSNVKLPSYVGPPAEVTFEVLVAWKGRPPKSVTVYSSPYGASCGWVPAVGGYYLVFAHRYSGEPRLQMGLCSNHVHYFCAQSAIRQLGRPTIRHSPLPTSDGLGTDDSPVPPYLLWSGCTRPPQRPLQANLHLPPAVEMKDFSATILRDGTVRDLSFKLVCAPHVRSECTDELEARIRATVLSWRYRPGTFNGREVAMRIEPPQW
jgi:hypothetical protein